MLSHLSGNASVKHAFIRDVEVYPEGQQLRPSVSYASHSRRSEQLVFMATLVARQTVKHLPTKRETHGSIPG